jgi:hypothetical protein
LRHGSAAEYRLTAAGEELRPIVMALGHWGARWIGSRLKRGQLDAGFLMWDIRRFVHLDEFPPGRRTVIHFCFTDAPRGERAWWLVVDGDVADLCRDDPGHELTLIVESSVRALTEIWTGDRDAGEVVRSGDLRVQGPARDAKDLWRWLGRSAFAETRAACRLAVAWRPGPAMGTRADPRRSAPRRRALTRAARRTPATGCGSAARGTA